MLQEQNSACDVCSSGTAFQEMALHNGARHGDPELLPSTTHCRALAGCPRNDPCCPDFLWSCLLLSLMNLFRTESPERKKFNGQNPAMRNTSTPKKVRMPENTNQVPLLPRKMGRGHRDVGRSCLSLGRVHWRTKWAGTR